MKQAIKQFWMDEQGQDLTEYSLLLGLMALSAVGLMRGQGTSISSVWTTASTTMKNAAVAAS